MAETSYGGKNAYQMDCEVTGEVVPYGICQIIVENVRNRVMIPKSYERCVESIKAETCPAVRMQKEEAEAKKVLYFEPWKPADCFKHTPPVEVQPEHRPLVLKFKDGPTVDSANVQPKRGGVAPVDAIRGQKDKSPLTFDTPSYADVINAAIAEAKKPAQTVEEPVQEQKGSETTQPAPKPASAPQTGARSLADIARSMMGAKQ